MIFFQQIGITILGGFFNLPFFGYNKLFKQLSGFFLFFPFLNKIQTPLKYEVFALLTAKLTAQRR